MSNLSLHDPEIAKLILDEDARQLNGVSLIPSENHTSRDMLEALATTLSDKYAEGYPGRRYYSGNVVVDQIEILAQERAKKLFDVPYVNVQPYSGSTANLAIYVATCEPHDAIMGLNLPDGGHLTHGWKFSATAKFWTSFPYHLKSSGEFDFEEIRALAIEHKPKIIWCGGTAIPRAIPFAEFAKIADEVGALLIADVSHIAGLIVGGQHESPVAHAHIVITTTHKTLRGPRGAMIMVTEKGLAKDPTLGEKIDKAIIPGTQGGPHMNTIAAIAVALKEASQPEFQDYAKRIVENAKTFADALIHEGFQLVSGGTDNHLLVIDLSKTGIGRGKYFALALERVGIYANMNTIPGDTSSPLYPSGLRIGTPAATTRGMGTDEIQKIAHWMAEIEASIKDIQLPPEKEQRADVIKTLNAKLASDPLYGRIADEVSEMCRTFPIPANS